MVHKDPEERTNVMIVTMWSQRQLDEINTLYGKGRKYSSRSETIRECTGLGMEVLRYKEMMKDPEQAQDFRLKMKEMIETENMHQWAESLQSGQLEGIIMMLKMENEQRYQQRSLN